MFILLQRRNKVGLVLTVEDQDDPGLEAFMDRFNISKACGPSLHLCPPRSFCSLSSEGVGSIAQLADSELVPPPSQLSSPQTTPVSDISHDTPSALPYGSPMSDVLSPPSPLPMDEEAEPIAPAEERSSDLTGSRPPSPDTSMEVTEDASFEVPDEEPLPPPAVDSDLLVDVSSQPLSPSSEVALAETRAETPQAEVRSDVFEGTEAMDSIAPSEAAPVHVAVPSDEDSRSEGLASPVITESIVLQEDMDVDVDVVGEPLAETDEPVSFATERSQSAPPSPLSPQVSQTEVQPLPPTTLARAPVLALPPSAFILPPKPSTEVFIPATLAPVGESPQYSLDLVTTEPRSLITSEWLNPEFSLNRNYTLPSAKSLPLDQQRRLKLGKSLRKKEKEKDKGPESRKDATDDWMPLGINKWGVTIKANPLWKRVSRATKTMTTRDWNVSIPSYLVN
jgi:chromatin modification-related protein VID21